MTALISTDGYAAPLLASKNNLVIKAERLGFLSTRDKLKFMAFGTGPSEAPDFRTLHQPSNIMRVLPQTPLPLFMAAILSPTRNSTTMPSGWPPGCNKTMSAKAMRSGCFLPVQSPWLSVCWRA